MTEVKISDTREVENPEGPNTDDIPARCAGAKEYLEQVAVEASGEAERRAEKQAQKVTMEGEDESFARRRAVTTKVEREALKAGGYG